MADVVYRATGRTPVFDDRDAEQLFLTIDYTPPDPGSARFLDGTPSVRQPAAQPTSSVATRGLLALRGISAFRPDTVRIDVTATDPHGASVSTWYRVILASPTPPPRFASTASPPW